MDLAPLEPQSTCLLESTSQSVKATLKTAEPLILRLSDGVIFVLSTVRNVKLHTIEYILLEYLSMELKINAINAVFDNAGAS